MAKRRGLFKRIVDAVLGRKEVAQPPPAAPPKPPAIGPLRQRALSHFMSLGIPMTKRSQVEIGINAMTVDELMWTIRASAAQIQWRAGHKADRLAAYLDGSYKPLNPWWYL